jgi:hypothetical protein
LQNHLWIGEIERRLLKSKSKLAAKWGYSSAGRAHRSQR